ncbi:unnamed protein product [Peniophora sp. CBMAI 1063]|nr:unnamed protein product [Peniophora sp. CBMAI 1063]
MEGKSPKDPVSMFTELWAEAIKKVEHCDIGKSSQWKSLLDDMASYSSADEVCNRLEDTVKKIQGTRASGSKWGELRNKYLKPTVEGLLVLNNVLSAVSSNVPGIPGGSAIFAVLGMLLEATKGVSERFEALIELFEEMSFFLESLNVRTAKTSEATGSATRTVDIAILAHLLDVLRLATELLKEPAWRARIKLSVNAFAKNDEIQESLKRLRVLTALQARAMTSEMHLMAAETQAIVSDTRDITEATQNAIKKLRKELLDFSKAEKRERVWTETLRSLNPVESAEIAAQSPSGCLTGTREELLAELQRWSRDPTAPRLYWINGMAGAGKSAIARTFCRRLLQDDALGGSFFCSRRGSMDQRDVRRVIPALSASLALYSSCFKESLLDELYENKSSPVNWNLEVQVERLITKPLSGPNSVTGGYPMAILVIDALDECSNEDAMFQLLSLLVHVVHKLPIKVFMTSRPEQLIRRQLEQLDGGLGRILKLHEIKRDIVEADIRLYLEHGLHSIPEISAHFATHSNAIREIYTLAKRSETSFIYVSTVLLYLQRGDPVERFSRLTSTTTHDLAAFNRPLDSIYSLVLLDAVNSELYDPGEISLTQRVLAILVTLIEPLSVKALAALMDIRPDLLRGSLNQVYAVVDVPARDDTGVLSTLHASFGDFLTTPSRTPEYMLDIIARRHELLAHLCVRYLHSDKLSFNVSHMKSLYSSHLEQTNVKLQGTALSYACRFAGDHLSKLPGPGNLLPALGEIIMGPKFLFMLEVFRTTDQRVAQFAVLNTLLQLARQQYLSAPGLIEFSTDAIYFVLGHVNTIRRGPQHIYLSALISCDPPSAVHDTCRRSFVSPAYPKLLVLCDPAHAPHHHCWLPFFEPVPQTKLAWPAMIAMPISNSFSADCSKFVGLFGAHGFHVWDTHSGVHVPFGGDIFTIHTLRTASKLKLWVQGMLTRRDPSIPTIISEDGSAIVTVEPNHDTPDRVVHLWDTHALLELPYSRHRLKQPRTSIRSIFEHVSSVALSADGRMLALGLDTGIEVHAWMRSEERLCRRSKVRHLPAPVRCIAFSRDGSYLAAGLEDGSVHLWSVSPDGTIPTASLRLQRTLGCTTLIVFSPDNSRVVSAGNDGIVVVWDISSDNTAVTLRLEGHAHEVNSIAWHGPGNRILVASGTYRSQSIHIWDAKTGSLLLALRYAVPRVITFSPGGDHLIVLRRKSKTMGIFQTPDLDVSAWNDAILGTEWTKHYSPRIAPTPPLNMRVTPSLQALLLLDRFLIPHIEVAGCVLAVLAIAFIFFQPVTVDDVHYPCDVLILCSLSRLVMISLRVISSLLIILTHVLVQARSVEIEPLNLRYNEAEIDRRESMDSDGNIVHGKSKDSNEKGGGRAREETLFEFGEDEKTETSGAGSDGEEIVFKFEDEDESEDESGKGAS